MAKKTTSKKETPWLNNLFLDGGPLVDKTNHGKLLNSVYASALGNYYANGGMLKRADGSYSQRGLWDNIRANKGSGKKPTKEMLAQEKKINKEYAEGGYLGDKGNTQVHTDKAGNTTTKFTKPDGTEYIKVKNAKGKEYNKTIPAMKPMAYTQSEEYKQGIQYPMFNQKSETLQNSVNQKATIPQNIENKKDMLGDLQKEKEAFAVRQSKDQISKGKAPRAPQDWRDKITDIAFNPMTAAGHWMRGQEVPDYLQESLDNGTYGYWANGVWHTERNPLDAVTDITPVGAVHSVKNIVDKATDNVDGNFWTYNTLLDAANIIPTAKLIKGFKVKNPEGYGPSGTMFPPLAPPDISRLPINSNRAIDLGSDIMKPFKPKNIGVDVVDNVTRDLEPIVNNEGKVIRKPGDPKFESEINLTNEIESKFKDLKSNKKLTPLEAEANQAAEEYWLKATSSENKARAAAHDKEYGTSYLQRINDFEKHGDYKNIGENFLDRFNIKIAKPEEGSKVKGVSRLSPEGLINQQLNMPTSLKDREIVLYDRGDLTDVSNTISHELKHHYTIGDDKLYNKSRLEDMIVPITDIYKSNPKFADELIKPLHKDKESKSVYEYLSSPEEIDAFVNTNMRDEMVKQGILKNQWDKLTEEGFAQYLANNKKPRHSQYTQLFNNDFLNKFNKSVYGIAGAGAVGTAVSQDTEYADGGQFTRPYSLPEDSFKQGGNNLHNSVYASSMGQYPAPYEYGGPMTRFYASNVEEPATIGKDLAYNNGGTMNPIHINPENKGKFNATKARTGKTTEELTHSSNPLTRKRAIFAQNASRWNHQYGGYMFAEGGNLDPLTTFDEGGKHSENKLGGIPQGQNAQGGMNLVEEGETKLNSKDYIFSDTLKVDKDTVAEFNLPKTMVGKTFADASKKMNRPDSRRINDSIEEKAKERDLNALMEAQEVFKEKEVAKKMEEIQSLNPGLFEQMQQAQMQPQGQSQPSPEEMMMQQGQPPMDPAMQQQMDPAMMEQMVAPQQGVPQQYGGQMSYKCGGSMYDFGGKLGEGIKNYGLGMADTTMSYLGMDNVIKDDQYEGFGADAAKGYAKVVGGIGKKVLPMAANMVIPGSGAVISGAQQLGSMANPQQEQEQIAQMGGMNFKYGGTFDMPRQQMYMPLDHVTEMGGELSIEDQGLQNLENEYRNSIFEGGGKFIDKGEPVYNAQTNQYCYPDGTCIGIKNPDETLYSKLPKTLSDFATANNKNWFTDGQLDISKISKNDILNVLNSDKENTKFFTGTNEWGAELNETPANLEDWVDTWKNYQTKNQEVYGLKDVWNRGKNEGYNNWLNATGTNNSDPNITNPFQTNPFLQTKKIEYSKDELTAQKTSVARQKEKELRETRNQNDPRLADLYTNISPKGYPLDAIPIRGAVNLKPLPATSINQSYNTELANPYIKPQGFTAEQLATQEAEPIMYPNPANPALVAPASSKNVMSYNPETMFGFTPTPMNRQEIEPQMYPTMATAANTENNIVPAVANNIVDDYSNRQMLASQEAEQIMYPPDAMQYPQGLTYAQANSAIAPGLQDSEIEVAQKMLRDASTEEEHAKALEAYQSAVARHDESLKNRNVDLTMNQTPMQAIGSALPIGYNIGMGLFGKVQQLNASDYMQKADIKAPEMNINPQLRATDQSFAQASNAGRNAGAGSEYLAYMSNLNNMRNKGYADLYGQKFNVDSQNAMNAQLQNKAIEGQNLQTKMGIVDYNARAKAAKTAMLQEGLKQAATLADNSKGMDAQLALMKAIAPDFAGDMKYNTIFDQYKNRTKKV